MSHADALNRLLVEALAERGVEAALRDGWIARDDSGLALRADAQVRVEDEGARAQVDVQVALPDGRLLTESHAAARATEDEAVSAAWSKFVGNSLPPLVRALFEPPADEAADAWSIGGEDWTVHVGDFGVEAFATGPGDDEDPSAPPPPPGPLPALLKRLVCEREADLDSPSWIRLFFAFDHGEPVAAEALWSGAPWPEASEALAGLDWGDYPGFYSVRLFLIVTRRAPTPARWPHDFRRTVELVRDFVSAIEAEPERADDDFCEMLIDDGVDFEVAEALVTFTAVAFAYHLFRELDLSSDYYVANEDEEILGTRRLDQEPAFLAGLEVAQELDAASKATLTTVATRAELFHIIGAALSGGLPIPDTRVVRVVDSDEVPPVRASAAPEPEPEAAPDPEPAGSESSPAPKPSGPRPWWRFWG